MSSLSPITPPSTDRRVEAMDKPGLWDRPGRDLDDWPVDYAGAVTLPHLRSSAQVMAARGRPWVLASIEIQRDVRAALDDVAVDLYFSQTMPGDHRIQLWSPEARAAAGV